MNKEREVYFSVSHKVDEGKAEIVLEGSKDLFSLLFSSKAYVNELDSKHFKDARNMILNTTLNICNEDKEVRDKLLESLTMLNS